METKAQGKRVFPTVIVVESIERSVLGIFNVRRAARFSLPTTNQKYALQCHNSVFLDVLKVMNDQPKQVPC